MIRLWTHKNYWKNKLQLSARYVLEFYIDYKEIAKNNVPNVIQKKKAKQFNLELFIPVVTMLFL